MLWCSIPPCKNGRLIAQVLQYVFLGRAGAAGHLVPSERIRQRLEEVGLARFDLSDWKRDRCPWTCFNRIHIRVGQKSDLPFAARLRKVKS